MKRRSFIRNSLVVTAGAGFSASSLSRILGANDDIRVAVVGFHGQGKSHIDELTKIPRVRIVGLCDADRDVLDEEATRLRDSNRAVETYVDVRKLLANKDIDAVTTATPNHWHSLLTVWACQAGKDVYVEKPVSHEVWEGRKMIEAARKHNRVVQTGTQGRSNVALREALDWVRSGQLGKIKVSRGLCYKRRKSIGKVSGPQPIPPSIDYDLWCGPAPKGPLMRQQLHYDWHWVWPTGNGDLGNQGIHQMDIARWALGKTELSPRVFSLGGRFGYADDGETPNTQIIVHDYGDVLLIFEVRGLPERAGSEVMDKYRMQSVGNIVECENGYLSGTTAYDKDGKEIRKFISSGESHMANFIKVVRSRKLADLNADILEGHLSSALCHTGNISHRLGKLAAPGECEEAIKADKEAAESFERFKTHLAANNVDFEKTRVTLGTFLKMDPKTERFKGNSKANELLTRQYREPYVVPDVV